MHELYVMQKKMKATRQGKRHLAPSAGLLAVFYTAAVIHIAHAERIVIETSDGEEIVIYDPAWQVQAQKEPTPEEIAAADAAAAKHLEDKRNRLADRIEEGRHVALRASQPRPAMILQTEEKKRETLATMGAQILARQKAEFERVRNAPMDERLRRALSPEFGLLPVAGKNGQFSVLGTDNLIAAETISISKLWPGGSSPFPDLSGAGRRIGVWEAAGGVLAAHDEFQTGSGSRVVQIDDPVASNLPEFHNHATQVAGTIAAAGFVADSRGGAYASEIDAYDAVADIGEMALAASQGLTLSNHSYSLVSGWIFIPGLGWVWFGRDIAGEDPKFGLYTDLSRQIDLLVYQSDSYLPIFSSSNEVSDFGPVNATTGTIPPGTVYWLAIDTDNDGIPDAVTPSNTPHPPDGGNPLPGATSPIPGVLPPLGPGFDTVKPPACAKNNLVVGAIHDVPGGIQSATDARIAYFSSRGPTDDGRIKPDLVANGTDILTTDFDAILDTLTDRYTDGVNGANPVSGTSFATPSTTAAAALVQEINEAPLWASSLKAGLIHTADDATQLPSYIGLGPVSFVGPDYFYGWGSVNAKRAANLIHANLSTQSGLTHLREHVLFDGNTVEIPVVWDGVSTEMRFTIVWTDPAYQSIAVASSEEGVPVVDDFTVADDPTLRLVNDLDLRVIAPDSTTFLPWVLDPANPADPATKGDNFRDNVEQVVVDAPVAGVYTVRISHKGSLRVSKAIEPGHPQYDANVAKYELIDGQHQRFSLALSGNAELPGDRFTMTGVERVGDDTLLEWQSVPGLRYQIEASADLQTWTDVGGAVDATSTLTPFLTTEAGGTPKKFYRVREVGR